MKFLYYRSMFSCCLQVFCLCENKFFNWYLILDSGEKRNFNIFSYSLRCLRHWLGAFNYFFLYGLYNWILNGHTLLWKYWLRKLCWTFTFSYSSCQDLILYINSFVFVSTFDKWTQVFARSSLYISCWFSDVWQSMVLTCLSKPRCAAR